MKIHQTLLDELRNERDRRLELASDKIVTTTRKCTASHDYHETTDIESNTVVADYIKEQASKDVLRYMKAIDKVLGISS